MQRSLGARDRRFIKLVMVQFRFLASASPDAPRNASRTGGSQLV
jgi:hypothetical protein